MSTSRPRRSAISTQSIENWPKRDISTRSPVLSVLVIADSHAPVPEPGKTKTRPVSVRNTFFRSVSSGKIKSPKSGARMSSIGTFIARRTSSGMLVGPGMNRWVLPFMGSSSQVDLFIDGMTPPGNARAHGKARPCGGRCAPAGRGALPVGVFAACGCMLKNRLISECSLVLLVAYGGGDRARHDRGDRSGRGTGSARGDRGRPAIDRLSGAGVAGGADGAGAIGLVRD